MKGISLTLSTMAILTALAMAPAGAQERAIEPRLQLHAVNPSLSTSTRTNSPIQEQMRQDYAAGLMGCAARVVVTESVGSRPTGTDDRP
jgi:hypothetical protein